MLSGRSVTYPKVNFRNMQPNKRQQKRVIAGTHLRKIVPRFYSLMRIRN